MTPQLGELSSNQAVSPVPPIGVLFSQGESTYGGPSTIWNQRAEVDFTRHGFNPVSIQFDTNVAVANLPPDRARFKQNDASELAHRFVAIARELLGREQISAARSVLQSVSRDHVDEPSRRLMAVLARPLLRPAQPPRRSNAAELQWLRQNASQHHGRWVALVGGDLVDSDGNLQTLIDRIRASALPVSPFFHHC